MPRPPLFSARHGGDASLSSAYRAGRRPFTRPGTSARYARDRVADIRHIRLDVSFDFALKKVAGCCTTSLAPINDGLSHVEFDAVELTIRRVRRGDVPLNYAYDGRKLVVTLDRALASDEAIAVAIDYEAVPRRGMYFIGPDAAH